jgi:hypothetical protein
VSYKTHSTWRPKAPDPALAWAAVEAQRNACARGEHDVTTVPEGRAVYAPGGIRRSVGQRYCRCCLVTLGEITDG